MAYRFVDTNVLLRYFLADNEEMAKKSLALLHKVESGEEHVETSLLVVFETVFALYRTYRISKARVRDLMIPLLGMKGLHVPDRQLCVDALNLFVTRNISYTDAFNALYMRERGISEVYTWDRDFDRVKGIQRVEPGGG